MYTLATVVRNYAHTVRYSSNRHEYNEIIIYTIYDSTRTSGAGKSGRGGIFERGKSEEGNDVLYILLLLRKSKKNCT